MHALSGFVSGCVVPREKRWEIRDNFEEPGSLAPVRAVSEPSCWNQGSFKQERDGALATTETWDEMAGVGPGIIPQPNFGVALLRQTKWISPVDDNQS